MDLSSIPARARAGVINAFVEIPKGSRNKYEYDEDLGVMALDRALYSAVHYPTDYGLVPGTRASDGDHLDIMVMVDEPTFPGCLVRARLIGVLTIQGSGGPEPKLLGVPVGEPRFAEWHDIADVPDHQLKEIEHFFEVFKDLEGSEIHSLGWRGAQDARAALDAAIGAFDAPDRSGDSRSSNSRRRLPS